MKNLIVVDTDCINIGHIGFLSDYCSDTERYEVVMIGSPVDFLKSHFNEYSNYVIVSENRENLCKEILSNNIVSAEGDQEKIKKQIDWILSGFGRNGKTDNTWLISDTHFFHGNIIKYCNRPWNDGKDENGNMIITEKNITDMNDEIIRRWNSVVGKDDIVWHLGDFSFGKKDNVQEILKRLNGKVNLVMGNHDRQKIKFYYDAGFNKVYDKPVIVNKFFIFSHEPVSWVDNDGVYANIYGHVHNQDMYRTITGRSCCVCVERWDYTPVKFNDIINKMKEYDNGRE